MSVPEDEVVAIISDGQQEQNESDKGRLSDDDIMQIVASEISQSSTGNFDTEIDANMTEALDYYLGNPRGDEVDGRSQIVSTDVADAIEWIMPSIVKALVAKGPIIEFDALSQDDEDQAALETAFTHDTFMKENEGFLNLYEFTKDALMQKNGIFKVYYDKTDTTTSESYDGLNKMEFEAIASHPEAEITEVTAVPDDLVIRQMMDALEAQEAAIVQTPDPQRAQAALEQLAEQRQALIEDPPMIYAVEVDVTGSHGKVNVDCVDPGEFRVNGDHNSLSLEEARFSAHVRTRTRSDLIEDGYDKDIVNNATPISSENNERFTLQGESGLSDVSSSEDKSQDLLEIAECYMMIDVERSGVARLMQVVTLGSDTPTDVLEVEPIDENPFVSSSCIIMTHKFYGLSIYDRLKQLQDQKTSLWRNIMDNLYLQNNREKEVVETEVNLDDLLVSRPGGIKRVKQPNMIRELQVQPIGQEGYQMLDYLDQVRTGRVGVSPDTAGQVDALGTAVGSEGVARLQTAKEELTGLMVRVVAETGVKPAYMKIRNALVKYQDGCVPFKFKDEWTEVNPAQWGDRSRTTVKVGTGTGDDSQKVGAIQQAIAYQAKLLSDPRNTLVGESEIYEALDEFCRVSGLGGASPYFLNPDSAAGKKKAQQKAQQDAQAKKKQDQTEAAMLKAQTQLSEAEAMKGQAAIQSQQAKVIIEKAKQDEGAIKQRSENQKAAMQLQLDRANMQIDALQKEQALALEYRKLEQSEALKITELELTHERELSKIHQSNKGDDAGITPPDNNTD